MRNTGETPSFFRRHFVASLQFASVAGGWLGVLLGAQFALLALVLHGTNFGNCNYNSWDADDATITMMSVIGSGIFYGVSGLVVGIIIALCATYVLRKIDNQKYQSPNPVLIFLIVVACGGLGLIIGGAWGWLLDVYCPIAPVWYRPTMTYQQTQGGLNLGLLLGNLSGVLFGGILYPRKTVPTVGA